MLFVADKNRITYTRKTIHPSDSFLQHRIFADERQQLLRVLLPGQRPQTGAGTSGQDNGYHVSHLLNILQYE
jgi:hypothetical protein